MIKLEEMLTNDIISFEQLGPGHLLQILSLACIICTIVYMSQHTTKPTNQQRLRSACTCTQYGNSSCLSLFE